MVKNLEDIYLEDGKTDDPVEWYHVWPKNIENGGSFWLNFHSRSKFWDRNSTAALRIETDQGVAWEGNFSFSKSKIPFTYITTDRDRKTF